MSFFDSLLERRRCDTCLTPLWKLKINDCEYQTLKGLLARECVTSLGRNPFMGLMRECALFYAEYWRREYKGGSPSKEMIFNALEQKTTLPRNDWPELFYEAACKGARWIKIEMYEGQRSMPFYSMLYQGGVPMNLVTQTDSNGKWDRFVRGLVFRNINFDELDLGLVASQSQSMRSFCSQLCDAIDAKQYMRMPFYCNDEYNPWYQFLLNKFSEVRRSHRLSHPYTLNWEVSVDKIANCITIKYDLKGMQRLSPSFLDEHNLTGIPFFTVDIKINDRTINSYDYINGFCRYEVRSKHTYSDGDVISVYIHEHEQPYISESLDMNTPHLLYCTERGTYKLGNQIGEEKSLLLIPTGWNIERDYFFETIEYYWGKQIFIGVTIPYNYNSDVKVSGPDGIMNFSRKSLLYWTELSGNTYDKHAVIETVYDVDETSFILCYDGDESVVRKTGRPVEFRDKWENDWKPSPSYGEIFARTTEQDGNFVTPVKFINVGRGFSISVISKDCDSCIIHVQWKHGIVSTKYGRKLHNNNWLIYKENCEDSRKIPFEFTPTYNNKNTFILNVKAPFTDFSISDENGILLENDRYIPYSDLDKFQYHIYGVKVRSFKFGGLERKILSLDNNLCVVGDSFRKDIPFEGALIRLFDSRELIQSMLDRTSKNMLEAFVPVEFIVGNNRILNYEIKESPYIPQQKGDTLTILGKEMLKIDYKHSLKLLCLSNPDEEALTLQYDESSGFKLPDEINFWGKTLVIGRSRGRICPKMIDVNREFSAEDRALSRKENIASILSELNGVTLGSPVWKRVLRWYYRAQKEDIPASSLLDLYCVALDPDSLLKFTFILYLETPDDDKDNLLQRLIYFSNDLAFQWYWLLPSLRGLAKKLQSFINDLQTPSLKNFYVRWALNQGEKVMEYLTAINDNVEQYESNCVDFILKPAITTFYDWAKMLCALSLQESYSLHMTDIEKIIVDELVTDFERIRKLAYEPIEFVENNQEELDPDVIDFFSKYSENGHKFNEQWLYQRTNALAAHFKGEIQLLTESDKIKRSIIFCFKSTRKLFLLLLNNKIAK
ncbi:MAG: hypothetical protein PHS38_09255 [Bacteroidales bacterium]|nr:hypothetical protein [Bacteroidales bacterium]